MANHLTSLLSLLDTFDPTLPLERARTIPSSWYRATELAQAEREVVFGDNWVAVGRADEVSVPGSFLTATIADEPILVIRDEAGTLRALANVCRHRGTVLVNEPAGKLTRIRCRYHSWTYDLSGRLRGVPEFDGVADFSRDQSGLPSYAVDIWGPLVWVHLGKNPENSLSATRGKLHEVIAPLVRRMADQDIEKLRFVERREYHLACNWKVFVDNYLDGGYHVNTVHPALSGVLDYTQYRTEIEGCTSVQISPLKPSEETTEQVKMVRQGQNAYYWYIYPNLMLNFYAGVMDTNVVLPTGPETCRVLFDFYFAQTEGEQAQRFIADSIQVAEQVQQEDIHICEEVQRGLRSRSYFTGRFSVQRENGGYHFHQLLAQQLRAYASTRAIIQTKGL